MDDTAQRAQRVREIAALRDEITQLAGHLNAANYRFLELIVEFERREGWADNATHSCAHWLNWKCGIAMGAAREKVRVARALESLPKISAAMERGEISYSKVREMTRVACAATEEALLMFARHGTAAHVEKMVRGFRRAKNAEELQREAVQQAERSVTWQYDADGSLLLRAKLPAETGVLVLKALELAIKEIPLQQVSESRSDVPAGTPTVKCIPRARRADALALLAESFLEHSVAATTGGDRTQIVVHVAEETLRDHAAGCCELEHGNRSRNRAPPCLRRKRRPIDRKRKRRPTQFRPQNPHDLLTATPLPARKGQGLPLPQAARTPTTSTRITSVTGPTAAPPNPRTS